MAGIKTEFSPGNSLFYPIESLPKLFNVVGTRSKKRFFEVIAEREKAGGEGISIEEYVEMIRVGLLWDKPGITIDEVWVIVKGYSGSIDDLENVVADAFANSQLTDMDTLEKKREIIKELKELEIKQMENLVALKKGVVNSQADELKVADTGEFRKSSPPKKKTKTSING